MSTSRMFLFGLTFFLILATTACSSAVAPSLICDIDNEGYSIDIAGEEPPASVQSNGEKRTSRYDPGGRLTAIEIAIDRTYTFEQSGNVYDIKGEIKVSYENGTVNYDITATSETLSEPLTCKK